MEYRQPTDVEIRRIIESVKDKQYQMAYKYQYETLGRISEVCGKYMPTKDQHRFYEIDGEEFVMFINKTAKRKGMLRPCARPLNPKYDPWAKELVDYIESGDEYPFKLHPNIATSKTYAMNLAKEIFDGLWWPMSEYTRSIPREYTEDLVKTQRWSKDGYEEYLVVFPDGERGWTKDKQLVGISDKVETRWNPVTSHVLRKIAVQSLRFNYGFDDVDAAYFGGWTVSPQAGVSTALNKHYMFMDLKETENALYELERIMKRYAKKLLVEYSLLV